MNDAKIKDLIDEKFHMILCQSEASLKFSLSKKERRMIMSKWDSYIGKSGMTMVSSPKNAAENAYVRDPATDWFNSGSPSVLSRRRRQWYVKIPRDLALKILVLGSVP